MKNYFTATTTLSDLKKEYKKLAMANHPDRGGDTATMQEINSEYDRLFKIFQSGDNCTEAEKKEVPDDFRDIINSIITFLNVDIEICGTWIWVGGETKPYASKFKELGFKWRNQKKKWSYGELTGKSRGWDMEKIRSVHGSTPIKTNRPYSIT